MKTKFTMILILMVSLLSVSGCAKKTPEEIKKEENAKLAETLVNESWKTPSFVINGKVLTLPFKFQELLDLGFVPYSPRAKYTSIPDNSKCDYNVKNDDYAIKVFIANDQDKYIPVEETYVTSFDFCDNLDKADIHFTSGLSLKSTQEEVITVMGEPSSTLNNKLKTGEETVLLYDVDMDSKYDAAYITIKFVDGKITSYVYSSQAPIENIKDIKANREEKAKTE